jgi:hypothetical protein
VTGDRVSLDDLGVEQDPGTAWHPRTKDEADDLPDLDDEQVTEHLAKPEADPHDRDREAESSTDSAEDAV